MGVLSEQSRSTWILARYRTVPLFSCWEETKFVLWYTGWKFYHVNGNFPSFHLNSPFPTSVRSKLIHILNNKPNKIEHISMYIPLKNIMSRECILDSLWSHYSLSCYSKGHGSLTLLIGLIFFGVLLSFL